MTPRHWLITALVACACAGLALVGLAGSPLLLVALPLAPLGAALCVIDVRCHRLPHVLVLPGFAGAIALLGVVSMIERDASVLTSALAWSAGVSLPLAAIALASPSSLGFGDAKLAALLALPAGALGGATVATWLLLAFAAGGLAAIGLLLARRATRHSAIAFGPFLIAGLFGALALA